MKHYLCKIKDYLKIVLKAMVQTHAPSAWAGNQYPEADSSYAKGIPICLSSAHLPTSHWQVSSASRSSHGMSVLIYHDGPPLSSSPYTVLHSSLSVSLSFFFPPCSFHHRFTALSCNKIHHLLPPFLPLGTTENSYTLTLSPQSLLILVQNCAPILK